MLIALAWYAREDYPFVLALMRDARNLHATFDEWEESARFAEDGLRKLGKTTVRVMIKPAIFVEWCVVLGLQPNAKARSKFASDKAQLAGPDLKDGDVIY